MQERGARYQVADELRIPAPPLYDRGCHTFAPSLDSRASAHSGGGERKGLAPIPILVEPKKFHSILDTVGVLKNSGTKMSVGRSLFFFDM